MLVRVKLYIKNNLKKASLCPNHELLTWYPWKLRIPFKTKLLSNQFCLLTKIGLPMLLRLLKSFLVEEGFCIRNPYTIKIIC
jgi:hypothetical protein